jgi:hypothetical protein
MGLMLIKTLIIIVVNGSKIRCKEIFQVGLTLDLLLFLIKTKFIGVVNFVALSFVFNGVGRMAKWDSSGVGWRFSPKLSLAASAAWKYPYGPKY